MNILHRLRAEYIRAGMASLPDVRTAKEKYAVTEAEIPGFGTVIFLSKQFRYRHGKSDNWFWTVPKTPSSKKTCFVLDLMPRPRNDCSGRLSRHGNSL